jgi:hypothetical protein
MGKVEPSLSAVQRLFDGWGDGADFGAQLLLDAVQVEAVVVGDEVDGQTQVAETTGAAHAVQVGLRVFGEVKVDDHVDGLDVDSPGEEVCKFANSARIAGL